MTEEVERRIKTSIEVADRLWREVKILAGGGLIGSISVGGEESS